MWLLITGLAIFFIGHFVTGCRCMRTNLIDQMGASTYKIGYSIIAFVGLLGIIYGFGIYRAGGYIQIWSPPKALFHLNMLFSTLAIICLVAANLKVGFIKSRLKHPFLVGIKLWALGHFLANGDLGSMLIFGSFLAYAVFNRIQMKKRGVADPVKTGFGVPDILALVIGLGVTYALVKGLHLYLIGVPALA
jgi:uncharacterized membrane protein